MNKPQAIDLHGTVFFFFKSCYFEVIFRTHPLTRYIHSLFTHCPLRIVFFPTRTFSLLLVLSRHQIRLTFCCHQQEKSVIEKIYMQLVLKLQLITFIHFLKIQFCMSTHQEKVLQRGKKNVCCTKIFAYLSFVSILSN